MRLLITEPYNEEAPTGLAIEQREWNAEVEKWILLARSMNGGFKDDRGLQRENTTVLPTPERKVSPVNILTSVKFQVSFTFLTP